MSKKIMSILIVCGILFQTLFGAFVSFKIIGNLQYDDPMLNMYQREYDGEADYDGDTIINDKEKEYGTNMYSVDTDNDALSDNYEIETILTDPCKADTDGDSLSDYIEIKAGLNPLEVKTDGTTHDKDRTFEEKYQKNDVKVTFNGNAEIFNTYCDTFSVSGLDKTPGVMSKVYELYNEASFQETTITFTYDEDAIENKGGSVDNLSIFTFEDDGSFKQVKNAIVNEDENTVSVKVANSAKYLLADKEVIKSDHKTKIMLLIDNSGSMFPPEMCEGSEGNDVDFKRLDMAKSIIENIDDKVEYGLARFTGSYFHTCDIGTKKETLFSEIDKIRDIEEEFNGTYIATSIINSLDNFTSAHKNDRKFVIILTDGASTEHSGLLGFLSGNPDENDVIKKCNEKNVSVITIGLGHSVDSTYLTKIASQTGGAYIVANNDDALEQVYNKILTQLVYSAEDINADGKTDSYVVADSGFEMSKDTFSFNNLAALVPEDSIQQHGFCYGMAVFSQMFYQGKPNLDGNDFSAKGYSIPDFNVEEILKDVKNLREYKNETMNTYDKIYEFETKDRYTYKDKALYIKKDIKEKYKNEYISYKMHNVKGKWGNKKYTKAEYAYIDIEKYINSGKSNNDMEMLCMLYWHWATQLQSQNDIKITEYSLNNDWLSGTSNEYDYGKIIQKISEGVPLVVSFSLGSDGGHAINAIRVLRDTKKPHVYYLECYDNNDKDNVYLFKLIQDDLSFYSKTSVSNWGANFCVKPYIYKDGEWKDISLTFSETK